MIIEVNADNFREEVVSSDELTLVDIYATWCGPCKALSPVLEEISEKYAEKIKVVKVNVDENENLAVKFGVTSVPVFQRRASRRLVRRIQKRVGDGKTRRKISVIATVRIILVRYKMSLKSVKPREIA